MNRLLQIFNLLGVMALAVLCAIQWQANRLLNLQTIAQEKTRLEQMAQLAEKDKVIQGATADLDDFRARLSRTQNELTDAQQKWNVALAERDRLATERDQLKVVSASLQTSLDQWTAAVAARDLALKQAAEQARKLANDRNDAVQKFNDLAGRYNTAAAELKQAAQTIQKLIDERNDAVGKFNDLANKYNQIVKELNGAATRP